jgi:quercetin dioxygenase-like cupin family protein
MKVINYKKAATQTFEGETVKGVTGRIAIGKDDGAGNFCMRVFTVAPGGFTPKHSHYWEHEVFIHAGQGKIFREGDWLDVASGTVLFIPGGEEHQFKNTGKSDLVFVCLIPSGVPEL